MQEHRVLAYEGNEPYIFISYAHKDSDRVMPILQKMQKDGYRIWYDDGIAPGSEWPENIAQHMNHCAVTVAMVSNNSMASPNCRREVTYALAKKKPFLGIFLEETAMSPGMELQMSAQQCIMKYSYPNESQFFDKVHSCPDLLPCRQAPEPVPVPQAQPPQPTAPAPTPKAPPAGKKLWIPIAAGLGAAALILAIVLAAGGNSGSQATVPQNSSAQTTESTQSTQPSQSTESSSDDDSIIQLFPGFEVDLGETYLSLSDVTITADTVAQLNRLTDLEHLSMDNCRFEANALDALSLPNLYSLLLTNTSDVTNLDFLANSPLLEELDFSHTAVADLSPLAQLKQLLFVRGAGSAVTDLSPLAMLEELLTLDFSGCALGAVTENFHSLYLEELRLSNCGLTDISGFQYCTVLHTVFLDNNELENVSILGKSSKKLSTLSLSYNPLTLEDLDFLLQCEHVTELHISGISLGDLSVCYSMTDLRFLEASHCDLTTFYGLSCMGTLEVLLVSHNNFTEVDISTVRFADMPLLDMSYCQLTSAPTMFLDFSVFNLLGNEALEYDMFDYIRGEVFITHYVDSIVLLEDKFEYYVIFDCPLDQVVALREYFGKDNVFFYDSPEELTEILSSLGYTYP